MVRAKIETIITKKINFLSKLNEINLESSILFLKTDKEIGISNLFYQQFYNIHESYFKELDLSKNDLQRVTKLVISFSKFSHSSEISSEV